MSRDLLPAVSDLFQRKNLTLIAGPCVIESYDLCLEVAQTVKQKAARHGISYIFKASFDKANRTSGSSFRGVGIDKGLQILDRIRREASVPVLTDIHEAQHARPVADVVDVLQIPAFLCRQTDLLIAAASTGRPVNLKKGQFLAPEDMVHAVRKFREAEGRHIALTERGTTFGYHNLVVDFRSLDIMRMTNAPIIFDATHSVQRPGGGDGVSAGDRRFAPILARAAAAVGIDGLFCEVHPEPDKALSDGPNSLTYDLIETVLHQVRALHTLQRSF